jgi:hypothetical protein
MKWYWWVVIGLVFASGVWIWYIVSQKENIDKMAKVRDAKAEKAILKSAPDEKIDTKEDGGDPEPTL